MPWHPPARAVLAAALTLVSAAGCAAHTRDRGKPTVVVTTEIIADLVRQVGGARVAVESVVPPGGDPHSYEPSPADAVKVSTADVAFTNHLLLEEHALIKLFDANVRRGAPNVSLAENAERYGAVLRPLVEKLDLNMLWLGLAVRGADVARSAEVRLSVTKVTGPGRFAMYVTDALGQPTVYADSGNGLDAADTASLPVGAHTHLNWAFTAKGRYDVELAAVLDTGGTQRRLGSGTFTFAVDSAAPAGRSAVDRGHADLAVDVASGRLQVCTAARSCADQQGGADPATSALVVPAGAATAVPRDPRFAFLGQPGATVWQLPQAVLGKHVHGEVDPHTWQDLRNARAYVDVVAETLRKADPAGADTYTANRDRYAAALDETHAYVQRRITSIPEPRRQLVTAHDAFGYLAGAYGLTVAGFVVPNPAQEPSAAEVRQLTETVRRLKVPAVFVEPNLAARSQVLRQVASDNGVQVCRLYGDAFDAAVGDYLAMMRHNADEVARCLGGRA
ncbi:hypothetical protein GCM10010124_38700 [Pilimelia terevasa]|uniref:Anchored repeat ABC transporter, substrate-binding protein n=1 Tax=Pilimelia terevasa TaxID=53372 RepID=A0A8J3FLF5_9ACTN|nr:anchored repeat ABC transporter, substrate-binding protein [Pilimelia terevasa]GGK42164.1 hypothetical protein GCM10010124_38700 [Pilimelia terevasa]